MTIVYRRFSSAISSPTENTVSFEEVATVRIVGPESIEAFKLLVNRAMNCWDTAPAELKEFADIVTEGRLLQDYQAQANFSDKNQGE